MGINFLTVDMGNPFNIGTIIRTTYTLGGKHTDLYMFDPRDKLIHHRDEISRCSIGLLERKPPTLVSDLESFLSTYHGRVIAADPSNDAIPLHEFGFADGDLVLLGNENTGFNDKSLCPWSGMELVTASVIIPMLGENYAKPNRDRPVVDRYQDQPDVNVGIACGIVLYAALRKLGYLQSYKFQFGDNPSVSSFIPSSLQRSVKSFEISIPDQNFPKTKRSTQRHPQCEIWMYSDGGLEIPILYGDRNPKGML